MNPRKTNDNTPPDWIIRAALNPQWEKNNEWRLFVGQRVRDMWHTFNPTQQRAIIADADVTYRSSHPRMRLRHVANSGAIRVTGEEGRRD